MIKHSYGDKNSCCNTVVRNGNHGIDYISLAIACTLLSQYLYILGSHFGFLYSGAIGPVLAFLFSGIGVLKGCRFSIKTSSLVLVLIFLFQYTITIIRANNSTLGVTYFMFFAILPIMISSFDFDMEKVVRYTCYFIPSAIIILKELFVLQGSFGQMQMGYSYAIIPAIIATMIHFRYYRKKANLYMFFCYIVSLFLTVRILLYAVRGTVLNILTAVVILILIKYTCDGVYVKKKLKNVFVILLVGMGCVLLIYNLDTLLFRLADFFMASIGKIPASISKTIDSILANDIYHERNELYVFTINAIFKKPLFGYGISTFKNYSLNEYPHNCLLQLIFEGGIIGSFIPLLFLFYGAWYTFYKLERKDMSETAFSLLILLSTFPMLLLSNNMWMTPSFWLFLSYGGGKLFESKKR